MLGLVTELETKLQLRVAPHVIDIDGKPCHHVKKSLWKSFRVSTVSSKSSSVMSQLNLNFHLVALTYCKSWCSIWEWNCELHFLLLVVSIRYQYWINHAHDVYNLITCYFGRADVEIKLKKEEKNITQTLKKENKWAPWYEKLVKEKGSLSRKKSVRQKKSN